MIPPFLQGLDRQEQEKDDDRQVIDDGGQVKDAADKGIEPLKEGQLPHDVWQESFKGLRVHKARDADGGQQHKGDGVGQILVPGQIPDQRTQGQHQDAQGDHRAGGRGGDILREAHAVIVEQDHGDPDSGRQALVIGQGGDKYAQRHQGRAHDEDGHQGPVGGGQVYIAKLGEDDRIDGNDGQGDQIDRQQGQILPQNHLGGGDGEGVEELIGLLLALLGNDPHGQDGHDDHKDDAAEAEHIFEIAHRRLQIVQHGAEAHDGQQKCAEHIGGEGVEIASQFML